MEIGHRNPNAEADAAVIRRTLGGDRKAFDELVSRYQRTAMAVSYRLLGKSEDAQEVVQEAFFKAYRSLDTLDKPEAFGGWLMRIVSNLSLNFRRGRKIRQTAPLDEVLGVGLRDPQAGGDAVDPGRILEGKELGERLKRALDQLPEKQRLAVLMFTIEQLPQKQVAEALDCSVEAVKWHVFQARKRLREMLKDVM